MKLLIHDLNETEWQQVAAEYEGWEVLSDDGSIHPCIGCFSCWLRTPGVCVFEDAYQQMGEKIHQAEEVVIMSRYTYGGFSSFVKNVLDRSISYLMPTFVITKNEMHHKPRYKEKKKVSFFFRGHNLLEEQKELASRYVEAVRTNLHAVIKEIRFDECDEPEEKPAAAKPQIDPNRKLFLNCSLRGDGANSKMFLDVLKQDVADAETVNIGTYSDRPEELVNLLAYSGTIVLGMPLFVDGIPSAALRILEAFERSGSGAGQRVYVVSNMGFYESSQMVNLLSMVKSWCKNCGLTYCGGLAIGAGGMMNQVMKFGVGGPARNVLLGLDRLAKAINAGENMDDIYADAYKFPRRMYMLAANSRMKNPPRH
jgi:hypothetical protein